MLHKLAFVPLMAILALVGCVSVTPDGAGERTFNPTEQNLIGAWEAVRIGSKSAPDAVVARFETDGSVRGAIVCNSWAGQYALDGTRITFSDNVIITAAGCGPSWYDVYERGERAEQAFWRNEQVWLSADGQQLYMRGEGEILTMRRVESLRALQRAN
jgi:heat shock protein HslJ